ncbi:MAG: hypothetical protein AAGD86_10320 [Pseudomonadota bacterium]
MTSSFAFPAPWHLTGDGLMLFYRTDDAWRQRRPAAWRGRLAVAMWVNYRTSPVGPYREWLLIPGQCPNPRGHHYSIGDIFVDSPDSLLGGQQNWGIPKRLASFQWDADDALFEASLESEDGTWEVSGAARGPAVPVPALWQPFRLYQQRAGFDFWVRPTARARCRWFSVVSQRERGSGAPGLAQQRLLAAVAVRDFAMTFPPADIQPAHRET